MNAFIVGLWIVLLILVGMALAELYRIIKNDPRLNHRLYRRRRP